MKMEIIVLGKNFWEMPNGQKGANVVLYGDFEETSNKVGISVSEGQIDFDEHHLISVFPARYSVNGTFVSAKNRSGKTITTLKFSNFKLIEELELTKVK